MANKVRTSKNVCLYCFGDLNKDRVCTACKRKSDDTPSPPHHLPQRTVLQNRYLIGKALGEGGFGITYVSWDVTTSEKLAVKEYFPAGFVSRVIGTNQLIINGAGLQATANRGLKRFMDEAKVLAKIKNLSGVVSIKNYFKDNSTAYIVMEYLDGVSLKKYLQRKGGRLHILDILLIMRPIMESLIEVHKMGLIHRDISPDNIILTTNKGAKLIDFGAAKQSNLDGKSLSVVLKHGFAPEEQYRTHGAQGPWTDVYAIGVTIYVCITGQLPPESIQRMVKDTIVKPSALGADITGWQEMVLMKALSVDAKNRFQDVQSLMRAIFSIGPEISTTQVKAPRAASSAAQSTRIVASRTQTVPPPKAAAPAKTVAYTKASPKKTKVIQKIFGGKKDKNPEK